MRKFAAGVPFEFREIMDSAATLGAVLKGGRDEISEIIPVVANIAASFGISIQETTVNMVRALSAGIGAADLFRDRGIRAVLGFQAGVEVSAEETRGYPVNLNTLIQSGNQPSFYPPIKTLSTILLKT